MSIHSFLRRYFVFGPLVLLATVASSYGDAIFPWLQPKGIVVRPMN